MTLKLSPKNAPGHPETRPRGRPPGAARVVVPLGIRLHDLAVLRAVVQGVTPEAAVDRYVPDAHGDARVAKSHVRQLAGDVCTLVAAWGDLEGATALRLILGPVVRPPEEADLPSLAEFAEQIGGEDLGEQELQALYQERFGAARGAKQSQQRQALALRALVRIQNEAVLCPTGEDLLLRWLKPSLVHQLQAALGASTLQQLVASINRLGRNWHRAVPGLGRTRASRLNQWLSEAGLHGSPTTLASMALPRCAWPWQAVTRGSVNWPTGYDPGVLRASGANALGATTDPEALRIWLGTLDTRSAHTRRAYARDLERLLMWAAEQGKSLSSLTVEDATRHGQFLLDPPAHWVSQQQHRRTHPGWRPMRGGLSVPSAARALAAIGHCYGFLVETGYLSANPFARIQVPRQTGAALDVGRSFSSSQLGLLHAVAASIDEGPRRRRLQAILALATTTGVRISEAVRLWRDVQPVDCDGQPVVCLRVMGKGGRERLLPLKPSTVAALEAHREDRNALVADGVLSPLPAAQVPLISTIARAPGRAGQCDGALSAAGLHRALKRFFQEVAAQATDAHARAAFQQASFHFLRHTFAHQVLKASGQDLPVTQQLLGHASLATTGIYVKANLRDRARAIARLPDWTSSAPG